MVHLRNIPHLACPMRLIENPLNDTLPMTVVHDIGTPVSENTIGIWPLSEVASDQETDYHDVVLT